VGLLAAVTNPGYWKLNSNDRIANSFFSNLVISPFVLVATRVVAEQYVPG
jgi:hypothetical protein